MKKKTLSLRRWELGAVLSAVLCGEGGSSQQARSSEIPFRAVLPSCITSNETQRQLRCAQIVLFPVGQTGRTLPGAAFLWRVPGRCRAGAGQSGRAGAGAPRAPSAPGRTPRHDIGLYRSAVRSLLAFCGGSVGLVRPLEGPELVLDQNTRTWSSASASDNGL